MAALRRIFGVLFLGLGVSYIIRAGLTLVHLRAATDAWIQQSGDPDFKYDAGLFLVMLAIGATGVGALGWATAVKSISAIRGRYSAWLGPAIGALPLHWCWLLYRIIGAGALHGDNVRRANFIWFAFVTGAYFLMWLISRRQSDRRSWGAAAVADRG